MFGKEDVAPGTERGRMRDRRQETKAVGEGFQGEIQAVVTGRSRDAEVDTEGLRNAQGTSPPGHSLPLLGPQFVLLQSELPN